MSRALTSHSSLPPFWSAPTEGSHARLRAYGLIARNPELNPDITGLGPEARWSWSNEAATLGAMNGAAKSSA
jgi:hypothetical protein